MMGVIEGGWEYVEAAYTITLVVFSVYTLSLLLRARSEGAYDAE